MDQFIRLNIISIPTPKQNLCIGPQKFLGGFCQRCLFALLIKWICRDIRPQLELLFAKNTLFHHQAYTRQITCIICSLLFSHIAGLQTEMSVVISSEEEEFYICRKVLLANVCFAFERNSLFDTDNQWLASDGKGLPLNGCAMWRSSSMKTAPLIRPLRGAI